ncbi:hypothetical protein EDD17DRAFT_1517127 [Pisolithus thermaeus]|nr:hypothetical protein EV401DRAFT_1895881 [Pisolithus croceorrhizus]KAI6137723.1 hypothetical protein EDD17DRAFT_1517127 [Pisolithus thermaeus]
MDVSDLHIDRAPDTLTLSKDKGYNIAVGDTMEVARGQWHHSQGIVKAVDLIKASLDIVCPEDGTQINVPITFACKFKERFDHGLSRTGMLLDGTLLPPQLWCCLKSLHNRSFITPVVPHNATPPPSPGPSNADPLGAWSTTPDDIIQTQTPDYVTGHNTGSAIQHLTIPARYLMPANPTGKNQLCLVLKEPQAGRVIRIMKCQRNSKSVVTEDVRGLNIYEDNDMGLIQSHFAGMRAIPLKGDTCEGNPLSCNPAPTAQISHTATLVEVAQKCKFCEDQDSALGPPTKIPRGTSLVFQTSSHMRIKIWYLALLPRSLVLLR